MELRKIDGINTTTIRSDKDIHWVLTVPAIWEDLAKQFMRDAAIQAGIPDEMLSLALEPEAASIWCQKEFGARKLPIGLKYTLVDLGGGTGDITCHEKQLGGRLKELLPPTGGAFGGNVINQNFIGLLQTILGNKVLARLKEQNHTEYREMLDRFELKKRKFEGTAEIRIQLPLSLLELFHSETKQSLKTSLKNGIPSMEGIKLQGDKLHLSANVVNGLYSKVVTGITEKIRGIVDEVNPDRVILAGGFSASLFVQREIKANVDKKVKVPKDPEMAVLKGAVLYGHRPSQISSRKCKYTYGIARMMRFKQEHRPERKVILGGVAYVDNLFNKHIEIGQEVNVEDADKGEAHEYFPPIVDLRQVVLEVYASRENNPMYADEEGCHLVGLMKFDIDPQGDIFSKILVKIIFGGTELIVEARDVKNDKVYRQSLDFFC